MLLPLAVLLPVLEPALALSAGEPLPVLATALSACYVTVLVAGALLVPRVRSFQRVRVRLRGADSFPNAFYCAPVAAAIAARCEAAVAAVRTYSRRAAAAPVLLKFGAECSICMGPIEPGRRARELHACGHSFHEECILPWLLMSATPRCPNCREVADLDGFEEALAAAGAPPVARRPVRPQPVRPYEGGETEQWEAPV